MTPVALNREIAEGLGFEVGYWETDHSHLWTTFGEKPPNNLRITRYYYLCFPDGKRLEDDDIGGVTRTEFTEEMMWGWVPNFAESLDAAFWALEQVMSRLEGVGILYWHQVRRLESGELQYEFKLRHVLTERANSLPLAIARAVVGTLRGMEKGEGQ